LLRTIEQDINAGGWDQPVILAELRWLPLPSNSGVLKLNPVPTQPQNPVGAYLRHLADAMTNDADGRELAALIADAAFFGFALFVESWTNTELTPEQHRTRTRSLADIPGSYESRDTSAVDIRGNVYGIHRRRGAKPLVTGQEGPMPALVGPIMAALRDMTLAVAERLPADRADVAALRKLDIPTRPDEMATYARRLRSKHQHGDNDANEQQQPAAGCDPA
jgi:hypothetical protein